MKKFEVVKNEDCSEDELFELGSIITERELRAYYSYTLRNWDGTLEQLNLLIFMEGLKFNEVEMEFTKDMLESGMVVEIEYSTGDVYKYFVVNKDYGLAIDGRYWTSLNTYKKILKVWKPSKGAFERLKYKLNDDCLIYEYKEKSEEQVRLEKEISHLDTTIIEAEKVRKSLNDRLREIKQ